MTVSAASFGLCSRNPAAAEELEDRTLDSKLGVSLEGYFAGMPIDLVLVRHGQSEANIMIEMKKHGDFTGQEAMDKVSRHDSMMRLTDVGRQQARRVGSWVQKNIGSFDKFYVSEYVRTKETAAAMNLQHALWMHDLNIRERDQGQQDGQGDVKMGLTEEEIKRATKSPLFWAPVGGESMSDLCIRVRLFLDRLQAQGAGMKCVVVAHYRTIHAFRMLLEGTTQEQSCEILQEQMPNCCIYWYSRRDENGRVHQYYHTKRRIAVKEDGSAEVLTSIVRPRPLSNDQLLAEVHKVPQVLNNGPGGKGKVVK